MTRGTATVFPTMAPRPTDNEPILMVIFDFEFRVLSVRRPTTMPTLRKYNRNCTHVFNNGFRFMVITIIPIRTVFYIVTIICVTDKFIARYNKVMDFKRG